MTESSPGVRIGVDVGGTFTDVVAVRDGELTVTKTPSTPASPDEGVVDGLELSRDAAGYAVADVADLAHGTTVATNAVLERDWADVALVTTEGFRDALAIGRQDRPDIYDYTVSKPEPVVPRRRRFEVTERLDERGEVRTALDEASVRAVADELPAEIESIAVSLLFAFENDAHERRVAEILEDELGGDGDTVDESGDSPVSLSLSSDVRPEIREYERTLVTALNAALKPVMDAYVGRLEEAVADRGIEPALRIMQSNGGTIGADRARTRPVNTLLSGPAAGVRGAAHVAGLRGEGDVITMDMGGTSCDVSLVRDGDPTVTTGLEIGEYPVAVPSIDVHTIGAGGGSIAWVDDGGALRVGPRSAGAKPGPVCYGRGGTQPTVTDAQVLCGRLDPSRFLDEAGGPSESANGAEASGGDGERGGIDRDAVEDAVAEHVAEPLGLSVAEAAEGILDVANASMERALRVVSVEAGHDPRDFGLVAYGGAGPAHAAALAESLSIPRVLVPRTAGVLSALGLLVSDRLVERSASMVRPLAAVDPGAIETALAGFEDEGRAQLGTTTDTVLVERSVDLRYAGQSFDLAVDLPEGPVTDETLTDAVEAFHAAHERRYGHASPDEPVELVTVRARVRAVVEPPTLSAAEGTGADADEAIRGTRSVVFDGTNRETPVYDRPALSVGSDVTGPAIVEGPESTVVVRPGWRATVDEYGTIVMEVAT
ncbi:N-methylhydantoinase A/acetone carboxylase, beta subunit [Halovivax ruber XH-70]|uniref:N-methylhydantoinase A/acetone carboxylase, beta subunit n=1 Tax=Halovivax ruber (strain DSM 18193 / JCM 13892 / XH-70) TaxID=797302 RepID=L0I939_HALRX|nr:hydantoinase/oxoprolinase family protein [Halovivax ruber]AGB14756.1 N-methylhydantoinase A/acetone carboxylase, beta subunit [Halovivax ruber XH-70]